MADRCACSNARGEIAWNIVNPKLMYIRSGFETSFQTKGRKRKKGRRRRRRNGGSEENG